MTFAARAFAAPINRETNGVPQVLAFRRERQKRVKPATISRFSSMEMMRAAPISISPMRRP